MPTLYDQVLSTHGEHEALRRVQEILDRLTGTSVVDADGAPNVLYHGTFRQFDRFEITSDLGFHFGTLAAAERRRKHAPLTRNRLETPRWRVISACLALKNPLVLQKDPGLWSPHFVVSLLSGCVSTSTLAAINDKLTDHTISEQNYYKEATRYASEAEAAYSPSKLLIERFEARADARYGYSQHPQKSHILENYILEKKRVFRSKIAREYRLIYPPPPSGICIIGAELRNAGFDGICYLNHFEAKNSISWCSFSDDTIIQIGSDQPVDGLAPPDVMSEIWRRPVTVKRLLQETPHRGRNPNYIEPKYKDYLSLGFYMKQCAAEAGLPLAKISIDDMQKKLFFKTRIDHHEYSLAARWDADDFWTFVCLRYDHDGGLSAIGEPIKWPVFETPEQCARQFFSLVQTDVRPDLTVDFDDKEDLALCKGAKDGHRFRVFHFDPDDMTKSGTQFPYGKPFDDDTAVPLPLGHRPCYETLSVKLPNGQTVGWNFSPVVAHRQPSSVILSRQPLQINRFSAGSISAAMSCATGSYHDYHDLKFACQQARLVGFDSLEITAEPQSNKRSQWLPLTHHIVKLIGYNVAGRSIALISNNGVQPASRAKVKWSEPAL